MSLFGPSWKEHKSAIDRLSDRIDGLERFNHDLMSLLRIEREYRSTLVQRTEQEWAQRHQRISGLAAAHYSAQSSAYASEQWANQTPQQRP